MNRDLMRVLMLTVLAFVLVLAGKARSNERMFTVDVVHSRAPEISALAERSVLMVNISMQQAVAAKAKDTRLCATGS